MLVINAEYINTNSDTVKNVFSFASWESKRGRLLLKWPSGVAFSTLLHLVTELSAKLGGGGGGGEM